MIKGIIYDLDGVITDTALYHYQAWHWMAAQFGHELTEKENAALKGVGRKESLEYILQLAGVVLSEEDKVHWMDQKNQRYLKCIEEMTPSDIFYGFRQVHEQFRSQGLLTAIGSSSKNTAVILEKLELTSEFDAVSDGTMSSRSKPAPDIFLYAAQLMRTPAENCLVFEDSQAGIDAALAAGMKAVSFGPEELDGAELHIPDWSMWDSANLQKITE